MKQLIILSLLALAVLSLDTKMIQNFESFKTNHGKIYANEVEEAYRFAVYNANMIEVAEHNSKNLAWWKGENQFSDLTQEEFKSIYLGFKGGNFEKKSEKVFTKTDFLGDVNWVTAGKVQRVKDQGQCGSCWAFSTVGSSESSSAIFGDHLGDFSEQQLCDCSWLHLNMGCNGGQMDRAFAYYKENFYCTEDSYPYTATGSPFACKASSCTQDSYKISGHTDVSKGDTDALKAALDNQPISIAVDANNWSQYAGGIFDNCGTSLDHGVLAVGYGADHWLVKNSWSASWGEDGFIRLAPGNTCGIANDGSFPNIA